MAKKVYVTPAQKNAAKMIVKRSTAAGRAVSPSVRKIADAKAVTRTTAGSSLPGKRSSAATGKGGLPGSAGSGGSAGRKKA